MAEKMDAMHNMIQKIMKIINKSQPSVDESQQSESASGRTH
jgi:hypothetical protein